MDKVDDGTIYIFLRVACKIIEHYFVHVTSMKHLHNNWIVVLFCCFLIYIVYHILALRLRLSKNNRSLNPLMGCHSLILSHFAKIVFLRQKLPKNCQKIVGSFLFRVFHLGWEVLGLFSFNHIQSNIKYKTYFWRCFMTFDVNRVYS